MKKSRISKLCFLLVIMLIASIMQTFASTGQSGVNVSEASRWNGDGVIIPNPFSQDAQDGTIKLTANESTYLDLKAEYKGTYLISAEVIMASLQNSVIAVLAGDQESQLCQVQFSSDGKISGRGNYSPNEVIPIQLLVSTTMGKYAVYKNGNHFFEGALGTGAGIRYIKFSASEDMYINNVSIKRWDRSICSEDAATIYKTTFSGTVGNSIKGYEDWDLERTNDANSSYTFAPDPAGDDSNTVVKMERTKKGGSSDGVSTNRMRRTLNVDKSMLISQRLYVPSLWNGDVNRGHFVIFLRDSSKTKTVNLISLYLNSAGKGNIRVGTATRQVDFPKDEWFTLDVAVNLEEHVLNAYVNGKKINLQPIAFDSSVAGFGEIDYDLERNSGTGSIYIDDIKLKSEVDTSYRDAFPNSIYSSTYSGTVGSSVGGYESWTLGSKVNKGNGYTYIFAEDPEGVSGNVVVKMELYDKTKAQEVGAQRMVRGLDGLNKNLLISQRFYFPSIYGDTDNNGAFNMFLRGNNDVIQIDNLVNMHGSKIISQSSSNVLAYYPKDTWFKIEVALDIENHIYDVYFDGTKLNSEPITFDSSVTSFSKLELEVTRWTEGVWYIDDISIREGDASVPTEEKVMDFDLSLGEYTNIFEDSIDVRDLATIEVEEIVFSNGYSDSFEPMDGGFVKSITLRRTRELDELPLNLYVAAYSRDNVLTDIGIYTIASFEDTSITFTAADFGEVNVSEDSIVSVYIFNDQLKPYGDGDKYSRDRVRIFLAGDSLMQTYDANHYPQEGWGQRLGEWLMPNKAEVRNYAVSGRSSKSYFNTSEYQRIFDEGRAGDFLLISFAANDEMDKGEDRATNPYQDKDTEGSYQWYLYHKYIVPAQQKGMIPILVTSNPRLNFAGDAYCGDIMVAYVDSMRSLAREVNVPLIDLYTKSVNHLGALGPDESKSLYMVFKDSDYADDPAFANTVWTNDGKEELNDTTHLRVAGARLVAEFVAEELRKSGCGIDQYLK
mgnify:FL=1